MSAIEDELQEAQSENTILKQQVAAWRDAWYSQRDLIGKLMWQHINCPHNQPPPIPKVPNWWEAPDQQFVRVDTRVYQRTASEWKLIAQGSTTDAAEAVIRLMRIGEVK